MYFKSLEIQGFKSFPDKTVLLFDTKTTAIVGRNGHGKSNISDALRWVMGEQGAKTLRGDKMEDVIFHGTETRRSMGVAKVALTIDNSDRRLLVDNDEVVITRKLYRTGESEYLINGIKSRLKDVHTLFMGTGLGRDGYSIIGQGRIEEIVNSKAANRREVFEEAAGVSKFLHQKDEAERNLSRTEDHLLRLLDIETELQTRLPVLEKQAEKAKKARELMDEEEVLSVALSVRELDAIGNNLVNIENSVLLNQGECEHFEREIEDLDAETETVSEKRQSIEGERDRLNRQSDSSREKINEANTAIATTESEISHNDGRISAIKEQIKISEKSDTELVQRVEEFKKQIVVIEKSITNIDKNLINENLALTAIDTENSALDTEHREIDRIIGELYSAKASAEIYISRSKESAENLKSQLDEANEILSGQSDEFEKQNQRLKDLEKQIESLTEQKSETENKLSGYSRLYEKKAEKFDSTREEFERIRLEFNQKKSRFDVLNDVERSMAGYYASVKSVITAAKQGKLSDIHGTVADIVRVDGKYSVAAETALGSALQNIIVGNESTAKRCLKFLKENKAGRATFLPLTSIDGRILEQKGLDDEEGFVGLGHEIVQHDEKYSGIIRSLLGRTVFAEDIDVATVIAKKYGYKFKIVTLDGQVINAGGSFTGGSVDKSAGIISRKREIETLSNQLQNLETELETSKANHKLLEAECAKMKLECEGMREELVKISGEELRLTAQLDGTFDMLRQFEEQRSNSELVLARCEKRISEEQETIKKHETELNEIAEKLSEQETVAAEKNKLLETSSARRRDISDNISALNIERLTRDKDIEGLNNQIAELNRSRENVKNDSGALLTEISALEEKNDGLFKAIENKRVEIEDINKKFGENKDEITALIKRSEELEKRATEIYSLIREKTEAKGKFASALAAALEKKDNLENSAEKIKTALWENYSLTPSEAVAKAAETVIEKVTTANSRLAEIKRKLRALGDINFAAIDEYINVKERHEELSGQLNDVRSAKRELEKFINEITVEIRARFLESFNDINKHFTRIFSEMFRGGSARLELTDSSDVLNSGIEIYAAPPGKVINNLIALSGGEKALVAITLYFSILLHRPTPFCMLDEVDAALDEVNVSQYINYLKKYSDTTQLMMITHRRSTIEGCDVLYGVFMQEKGVSRLLKQELNE
ncbi:MAG: chromosome segregation protein SMC [Oscillospiraceae bacterium]|nr:chromosome segregation protein SMC [Oscillospiraceae bacterium]